MSPASWPSTFTAPVHDVAVTLESCLIGHEDKYGLTLAYVFLEDGTFLNADIIRQGYGFAVTRFPFKHLEEFRRLEKEARDNEGGLWTKGP
jgi:micrococcal nuclease